MTPHPPEPRADDAVLVARYRNGESIHTIAAGLPLSAATVRRQLLAAGVTLRAPGTPRRRPSTAALRQHLTDGLTPTEIAERYQVSRSAVSAWLTRSGLRPEPPQRPNAATLVELYQHQGWSVRQIAERFEVCPSTVYRWFRQARLPTRPHAWATHELDQQVRDLYLDRQLTGEAIARVLGCSPATVTRNLERQGIPRRQRTPLLHPDALREAIDAGDTVADIARDHAVVATTVYRAIKRHGIDTPTVARRRRIADAVQRLNQALDAAIGPAVTSH